MPNVRRVIQAAQPDRIPKLFIPRTVDRLCPLPPNLSDPDQIRSVMRAREKLAKTIQANPIRYFQPHGNQARFLNERGNGIYLLACLCGNKFGKSTVGAIRVLEECYGGPLWGVPERQFTTRIPQFWAIFSESFDNHAEITIPQLKSWAPRGLLVNFLRNSQGHVNRIECRNGSIISLYSYDQGEKKPEGKDWNGAWFDEPPPLEIYEAVHRGMVVNEGIILVTATVLGEAWLFDLIEKPWAIGFDGSIHDNPWISEPAKDSFLDAIDDPSMRAAREFGIPGRISGAIYRNMQSGPPLVIPDHDIPAQAAVVMAVDPHEQKPVYCLWGYVDTEDRLTWFDWKLVQGQSLEDRFAKIHEVEEYWSLRPKVVVMDPRAGRRTSLTGLTWQSAFEEEGYEVVFPDTGKEIDHVLVEGWLRGEKPRMRFTERCIGRGGPVYQMLRYSWDTWKRGHQKREGPKPKPADAYKDFPDCIRYTVLVDPRYKDLVEGNQVIDLLGREYREDRRGRLNAHV